jgi:predicted ATPase
MLQYLAHLAVQRRWLIIGTLREEEVEAGTELHRMIEASVRERLCLQVDLPCLGRPDCDQLVRTMLPGGGVGDALLEHVYEQSLGNPLFAEELVREMQERSDLVLSGGSWHESRSSLSARVPRRVRALVSMRVAAMRRSAPRVLALAAAATATAMEVSLADLRTAAAALEPPISDPALFDALDCALQSRILEERNGAYAFRHPLVRSAVYEDLGRHRRDQLHAALGRSTAKVDRLRLAAAGPRP